MFIGGGALAIGTQSMTSFFPNIYNEDWFFLLDEDRLRPTTTTGRAVQKIYDPFGRGAPGRRSSGTASPRDCSGCSTTDGRCGTPLPRHWHGFLRRRASFITDVLGMVERMRGDPERRHRMPLSLKEARGRCQYIDPELCVRYVDAWRADRVRWRGHIEDVDRTVAAGLTKQDRRSVAVCARCSGHSTSTIGRSHLYVPPERLHHDAADFDPAFPVAVGQ